MTTTTSVHTDEDGQKGFFFRTVAGPLEAESEQVSYVVKTRHRFADPALIQMGGVMPQFEPYSRIGNKDYSVKGQPYRVWRDIEQYSEEGPACWYGLVSMANLPPMANSMTNTASRQRTKICRFLVISGSPTNGRSLVVGSTTVDIP